MYNEENEQNIDEMESQETKDINMDKENKEFQKEIDRLESARKEHEEKKKKEIERLRKDRAKKRTPEKESEQKQKMIGGQLTTVKKKTYNHKLEIFRNNNIKNLSGSGGKKIEKIMKKEVHGVTSKKKEAVFKAIKAYSPTSTVLKRKDFDEFVRRFKNKSYIGNKFKKVEEEGIDIRKLRSQFTKSNIDDIKRSITGQTDPYKYKSRGSDSRNSHSSQVNRSRRSL